MARIGPSHAEFAARLGAEELAETVRVLERLSGAVETVTAAATPGAGPAGSGPSGA
ncbi:hypothetical protein [Streptomyces sp. NPDC006270]|uniref:hypothetical protein n=1 Tax=Streptomyces sp. NPDC006270 TaxID=3364741 RepID=UPI0036AC5F5F